MLYHVSCNNRFQPFDSSLQMMPNDGLQCCAQVRPFLHYHLHAEMGNALHTLQDSAHISQFTNQGVAEVVADVARHPRYLSATSPKLHGTVLHWAAETNNVPLLSELMLQGLIVTAPTGLTDEQAARRHVAELVNQTYDLDLTPLMLASDAGHTEVVKLLIAHGADPHRVDRRGKNTCLHIAATAGHADVIQAILHTQVAYPLLASVGLGDPAPSPTSTQGAPRHPVDSTLLNKETMHGLTALHLAVCNKRKEAVQALLEEGASLYVQTLFAVDTGSLLLPRGSSALHAAVHAKDMDCAVLLLVAHLGNFGGTEAGRENDPRIMRDRSNRLPVHIAQRLQLSEEFCELLHPFTPLREQLQLLVPEQLTFQLPSLQELAAAQLREALLGRAEQLAAVAGVGGQLDGSAAPPDQLQDAARQLLLLLHSQKTVCISMSPDKHLCLQLTTAEPPERTSSCAAASLTRMSSMRGADLRRISRVTTAIRTDLQRQSTASQLKSATSINAQAVLDVVRMCVMSNGVCNGCSTTDSPVGSPRGCATPKGASPRGSSPVRGDSPTRGYPPGMLIPPAALCNRPSVGVGQSLELHSPSSARSSLCANSVGVRGFAMTTPFAFAVDSEASVEEPPMQSHNSTTGGPHNSTAVTPPGDPVPATPAGLRGLRCKVMPPSACLCNEGTTVLESEWLLGLVHHMQSLSLQRWDSLGSASADNECGVCFEESPALLLTLQPCKHKLCLSCTTMVVSLINTHPALCPFCRAEINGLESKKTRTGQ